LRLKSNRQKSKALYSFAPLLKELRGPPVVCNNTLVIAYGGSILGFEPIYTTAQAASKNDA